MKPIFQLMILACMLGCSGRNDSEINTDRKGIIKAEGIQFNYARQGKGEPLLVIGSSVYYPKAFSDLLKANFEMIFIDSRHFIPNYYPSDPELASLNLTTWAEDVEMIRKELNLDQVTVIGHSIHAQIALEYASKYPEHVKRLVMICGVPHSESAQLVGEYWENEADENRKSILATRTKKLASILKTAPADRQFALNYAFHAPLYWTDPNYDAGELLKNVLTSPKAMGKLFGSIPSKKEVITKLKTLQIPTLVITGKLDFACPPTLWEEMLQDTQIDYELMPNASHNPQTEEISQKEFDQILMTWLSKES